MEHTTFTAHKSDSMKWVPKSPLFYCHARYEKMFCYKILGYWLFSPAKGQLISKGLWTKNPTKKIVRISALAYKKSSNQKT